MSLYRRKTSLSPTRPINLFYFIPDTIQIGSYETKISYSKSSDRSIIIIRRLAFLARIIAVRSRSQTRIIAIEAWIEEYTPEPINRRGSPGCSATIVFKSHARLEYFQIFNKRYRGYVNTFNCAYARCTCARFARCKNRSRRN